jgi:antitoxin HigA-1
LHVELWITTEMKEAEMNLPNIHPGEILLEEFLKPMEISQNAIARAIAVPPRRINEIVHGKRSVTADTAVRLAQYFGTSEQFWTGLQADYDLEEARHRIDLNSIQKVA